MTGGLCLDHRFLSNPSVLLRQSTSLYTREAFYCCHIYNGLLQKARKRNVLFLHFLTPRGVFLRVFAVDFRYLLRKKTSKFQQNNGATQTSFGQNFACKRIGFVLVVFSHAKHPTVFCRAPIYQQLCCPPCGRAVPQLDARQFQNGSRGRCRQCTF